MLLPLGQSPEIALLRPASRAKDNAVVVQRGADHRALDLHAARRQVDRLASISRRSGQRKRRREQ